MPTIARIFTTAVLLALAAAAPASAGPFTIGPSDNLRDAPDLAVDAAGTAHVVYLESREQIRYCRLPRGAQSCASEARFAVPENGFNAGFGPQVALGDPNRVVVAYHGFSSDPHNGGTVTFAAASSDGGATFAPPSELGNGRADDVVLGPGNALTGPSAPGDPQSSDAVYLDQPLGGGASGFATLGPHGEPHETTPGMHVALAGGAPVITWNKRFGARQPALADELWAARWSGSGSIRDGSTWSAPFRVAGAGDNSVAAGPSGVFVGFTRQNDDGDLNGPAAVYVSRLDGTTVAEPKQAAGYAIRGVEPEFAVTVFGGLTQNASGRLTAVWSQDHRRVRRGRGLPTDMSTVSTATSANGSAWPRPAAVACEPEAIRYPRAGTAPDGGGFAVYTQAGGSRGGEIRAVPIGLGEPGATCGIEPDGRIYNEFGSSRVLVTRGRFAITIGCADGHLRCKGTGQLKNGRQTIGSRAYSLDPRGSRGWVFRLNRAGRTALARRGRLRVRAVFTPRDARATTFTLTLVENRGRATR